MRFLYLLLYITLNYSLKIYFPRQKVLKRPRKFFGRTIYVSNHASSFMDPLVHGARQKAIVFFMTRSDIFKPMLRPILWMAHMLPIFRQHDNEDTKAKNDETFDKTAKVLSGGRNLLIFGEGFTDDVFIRRLKPVKKGALRIGFGALEAIDWKKKIYVAAVGINYGDPNYLGSDVLISNSERICLNDYREAYAEAPNKVINELTKKVEKMMQEQITHVANLKWVFFHEHVTRLLRDGLHPEDSDKSIPLQQRWENSRRLALWMNEQSLDEQEELVTLKKDLEIHFSSLKKKHIKEKYLADFASGHGSRTKEFIYLATLWPIALLGLVHCLVPYLLAKKFVEKSFKRRVFWSSVKLMLGMLFIGLWNIPLVILMSKFLFHPLLDPYTAYAGWVAFLYYLLIPLPGVVAYYYKRKYEDFKVKGRMKQMDLDGMLAEREQLISRIRKWVKY